MIAELAEKGRMEGPFSAMVPSHFSSSQANVGPARRAACLASLETHKKEKICILVTTLNVAAVKPARSRKTAARINRADRLEEKGWLQGRYRHGDLCRLWSHLINITGVITISTSSSSLKKIFYCPSLRPFWLQDLASKEVPAHRRPTSRSLHDRTRADERASGLLVCIFRGRGELDLVKFA
jgi:hypothetical protein